MHLGFPFGPQKCFWFVALICQHQKNAELFKLVELTISVPAFVGVASRALVPTGRGRSLHNGISRQTLCAETSTERYSPLLGGCHPCFNFIGTMFSLSSRVTHWSVLSRILIVQIATMTHKMFGEDSRLLFMVFETCLGS